MGVTMGVKVTLLAYLLATICPHPVLGVTPAQITFYSEQDKGGVSTSITTSQSSIPPDSPILTSASFCVDLGLWKATLGASPASPSSTTYYGGSLGTEFCRNRPTSGSWSFLSLEIVGSPDLEVSTLSLFSRASYSGSSELIEASTPELGVVTSSYYITGSSNWATFPGSGYNGSEICWRTVASLEGHYGARAMPHLVSNSEPGVFVGSVRRGCAGDEDATTRRPPPVDTGAGGRVKVGFWVWMLPGLVAVWRGIR